MNEKLHKDGITEEYLESLEHFGTKYCKKCKTIIYFGYKTIKCPECGEYLDE